MNTKNRLAPEFPTFFRNKSCIGALIFQFAFLSTATAATFTGLGEVSFSDGTQRAITATSVSGDGQVVVGFSRFYPDDPYESGYPEAFRWTEEGGLEFLGDLSGGSFSSTAYGISSDGSTIVGTSNSSLGSQAFSWTEIFGMNGLMGTVSEKPYLAYGVSSDGSVIAGTATSTSLVQGYQAFRYTELGMEALGGLPDSVGAFAGDISADGSVIVGRSKSSGTYKWQAFRWTAGGGMQGLGYLPGENESIASAVSADGEVVVGISHINTGLAKSFRWTASTGMAALTSSDPDILDMSATDVSVDGALIVGQANLAGKGWAGAFIWDAEYGARNLETILVAEGVDLTGWTLSGASAISDDGTTIVGWGKNPDGDQEAWVACLMLCEDDVDVDSSSDEASNDDEIVEDSDPEESDTSEDDTPEDMDETDGSDDAEDSSEESSDDVEDSGSDTNSSDDADPDNEDESDHDYGHHHDADHDSHHDDEDEDHDRDGMPDSFEVEFGLDPFDARDANDDLDHDGIPNVKEYLYGARMDIITAASSTPLEDAGSGGGGSVGPAGILMLLMLYLSLMMWGRKKTSLPEQQ